MFRGPGKDDKETRRSRVEEFRLQAARFRKLCRIQMVAFLIGFGGAISQHMNAEISGSDREQIAALLRKQAFIEAVKLYRSATGCDLRTTKSEVEQIQDSPGIPHRSLL